MAIRRLDSVVFETPDLPRLRRFYTETLALRVATFERGGKTLPDESESYVNFEVGGTLLGFERGKAAQLGTVVLAVDELDALLAELARKGVKPERARANFTIIRDPDGREVILQGA